MKVRMLTWVMLLAVLPALAEDVPFNGRTLQVDAGQEARPVLRMASSRYSINRSAEQLVNQAQACLATVAGATAGTADPAQGSLQGSLQVNYRARFASFTARSQLRMEAGNGYFQFVQTDLTETQDGGTDANAQGGPISQKASGWEKAVGALAQSEDKLVDCLYQ